MFISGLEPPEGFWLTEGSFIVSDQAYCNRSYQVQPFEKLEATTPERDYFNRRISLARRVVERLFGMLKMRFQVLSL